MQCYVLNSDSSNKYIDLSLRPSRICKVDVPAEVPLPSILKSIDEGINNYIIYRNYLSPKSQRYRSSMR